jgi:phospholipid/cholesterol/gamma-HCH transport system ATP-binding protein
MSEAALIEAEDVGQRFGDRTIFEHVRFSVLPREIFVILGGSGCGKSTLMRQMIGLLQPTSGRVLVLGHDMRTADADVLTRIGVMFQGGALFGNKTLLENVMLPLEMHTDLPRDARAALAAVKLGLVGLADAANLQPAEISGGMAKRCAIARALALDPPLLFLDEPAAGLDPITSDGLDKLILDLRAQLGISFVVVSHELTSILTIGDRCIMLDRSAHGIIATGNPKKLRDESTDPRVQAFFRRSALTNA